jgi:hypothetical protein
LCNLAELFQCGLQALDVFSDKHILLDDLVEDFIGVVLWSGLESVASVTSNIG